MTPVMEHKEELNEETTHAANPAQEETVEEKTETPSSQDLIEPEVNDDADDSEETTYRMEEEHDEESDYSSLSKAELVELIEKAASFDDLAEAGRVAREVRRVIEGIFDDEEQAALEAFLEAGNEKEDFQPSPDELRVRFRDAWKKIQSRRQDQRARIEEEKQKNLAAKRTILEALKDLTENEEAADALDKVKELQSEWKKIRVVPREFVQELWDAYRFYLDKFYDNLSINYELKELDRKKNLEAKIELCMKVDQLQEESSIKKAMNMLNKYHDEWKHTGPVPREYSEEIWARFKAASDKIYEQKKGQLEELKEKRRKNFELKNALNEKLEQIATVLYEKPREWIDKTKEIAALFEEWRKIGPVPQEHNEAVWGRFKDLRNHFYRQKNQFFKQINKDKSDNLEKKTALCEKAEAIKDSGEWNKTTAELIRLQGEWKKIGPVPEKQSDEVWKRFRAACDDFFNRKEEHFKGQKEEQDQNLEVKQKLIVEVKTLAELENPEEVFPKLREIQKTWNSTGFVPIKFKNSLQKEFTELVDGLYKKHKRNAEEMKESQILDYYSEIAETPDGKRRLQTEERKLRDKMRFLKNDIETLENNIGFFSNSKTAGKLIKDIEAKIKRANEQMDRLKRELSAIKNLY